MKPVEKMESCRHYCSVYGTRRDNGKKILKCTHAFVKPVGDVEWNKNVCKDCEHWKPRVPLLKGQPAPNNLGNRCCICGKLFAKRANREIHEQFQHNIWHNRARNGQVLLEWEQQGVLDILLKKFGKPPIKS